MESQHVNNFRKRLIEVLLLFFLAGCFANTGNNCDFSKVGLWSTCGFSNTTIDECSKLNCCYASSSFTSSKNLSQSCVKPPDAFEWKNGTCHAYNGTVCLTYLGKNATGRQVFFDIRYGVAGTEQILKQFIQISDISVKGSKLCRHLIPAGICHMMLPGCSSDSRPELSCREDCDQIHTLCGKDIDRFYGALELYVKTNQIDFSHLNIPACSDFKYSYEYNYKKNESCTFIGGNLPCTSQLSSKTGIIRPSVSQGKYLANHNCTWSITVPLSYKIKLTFIQFDLEESNGCTKDYIIVKNGHEPDSPVLRKVCGKNIPTSIESSENKVIVQFVTDGMEQRAGFVLNYTQFLPGKDKEQTSDATRNTIIIGVCAALAILGLIVAIVVRHRWLRHKDYKRQEAEKDLEMFSSFTTVRDRIRQDSMPNPLDEALSRLTPEQKPPQCRLDKVEYVRDLGQGQFGKVFQGQFKLGPNTEEVSVAVKVLKEGSSSETRDSFIQEVTLMTVLRHENILQLLAVSTEEEPFCMVFEFMVNGDLNAYLRKNDPENTEETNKVSLPTDTLIHMATQIAYGMEYLGGKRFVHRDLATRNCLVGENFVVKIADFGMSRDVYESDYYRVGGAAMLPIRWMPPEALLYGKFTVESDVYSYGILLWEIFTYALQPFYGYSNDEVVKFIKKGVVLPKPDICPQEVYDNVMTKCWFKDPEKRLNFTEIARRFEGDYNYTEQHAPRKPKKGPKTEPSPAYSVPPSLKPESESQTEDAPKRIPSKKESVGSSPQYVNYNVEEDKKGNTIELRTKDSAFANPLYKKSFLGEDLYDRPKSHSTDSDHSAGNDCATVELPPVNARDTVVADDIYDRPKSHAVANTDIVDEFEGGTLPMPVKPSSGTLQKNASDPGYMNTSFSDGDEEHCLSNEEAEAIAKKRYVSENDCRRLSKKESKSSMKANSAIEATTAAE